jgi:hypothetical protein
MRDEDVSHLYTPTKQGTRTILQRVEISIATGQTAELVTRPF